MSGYGYFYTPDDGEEARDMLIAKINQEFLKNWKSKWDKMISDLKCENIGEDF